MICPNCNQFHRADEGCREPAECSYNCTDPHCPYTHEDAPNYLTNRPHSPDDDCVFVCPRCGEKMESPDEAEGCRDPQCPMQEPR